MNVPVTGPVRGAEREYGAAILCPAQLVACLNASQLADESIAKPCGRSRLHPPQIPDHQAEHVTQMAPLRSGEPAMVVEEGFVFWVCRHMVNVTKWRLASQSCAKVVGRVRSDARPSPDGRFVGKRL